VPIQDILFLQNDVNMFYHIQSFFKNTKLSFQVFSS